MPHRQQWLFVPFLLIGAPLLTFAVRAGFDGEYRGASGLVVGMGVFVGIVARSGLPLLAVAATLAAGVFGLMPAHEGFVTVAFAHYAGATAGVVGGYVAAAREAVALIRVASW